MAMRLLQCIFDGFYDVFSISKTGTLDYVARFNDSEQDSFHQLISERCGDSPRTTEIPRLHEDWDHHTYEFYQMDCRIQLVCPEDCHTPLEPEIHGFCQRYPEFSLAMERGDYLCAARILTRSTKLKPYHHLIGYIYRNACVWPLILYFLYDFSDESSKFLRHAIRHTGNTTADYTLLCEFAGHYGPLPFTDDTTLYAFFSETPCRLQLPVVGGHHHWEAVCGISSQMDKVFDVVTEDRIRGKLTGDEFVPRFHASISELFSVSLVREQSNAHDPHALAVIVTGFDGIQRLVGYVRKTIARHIDPARYRVRLAALGSGDFELFCIPE